LIEFYNNLNQKTIICPEGLALELSNDENAVISKTKVTGYLLLTKHHEGRSKAECFTRFGFSSGAWDNLVKALLRHPAENVIAKIEEEQAGPSCRACLALFNTK
jgi:hypothetical protein